MVDTAGEDRIAGVPAGSVAIVLHVVPKEEDGKKTRVESSNGSAAE